MSHDVDFAVSTQSIYSLTVTNTGGVPTAGSITITDTLPAGLTYVSAIFFENIIFLLKSKQ